MEMSDLLGPTLLGKIIMGTYPNQKDIPQPTTPEDNTMGEPTPWLDIAKKYLGQAEITGRRDNQFILDCFKFTGYKADHDEVPWCAAFVCRILAESKYKHTHSAAAVSFAGNEFGHPHTLVPGAVVVFRWASGQHHVSICHHVVDSQYVACIGGNQSDMVKISVFPRSAIMATRWPVSI